MCVGEGGIGFVEPDRDSLAVMKGYYALCCQASSVKV